MTTESNTLIAGQTDTDPGQQGAAGAGASAADPATQGQGAQGAADPAAQGAPGQQGQGTEGAKGDGEPQGAPEAYEAFKMPEGVQLDEEITTEFQGLAKELNLPQETAQKVADLGAKMADKWAAKQQEQIQAAVADWAKQTQADAEIGGDALGANVTTARKALDTFGTPALRKLLNDSGLGNHPEVIRFTTRVGKAMSEDKVVTGGAGSAKNPAKTLFPNQA